MAVTGQTAKLISDLDQMEAALTNMAKMTGAMRTAMIETGMPMDEAALLTRDWWRLQLWKALYPDSPPPFDLE
jgi:hypothetical protein